jgi:hypothetical protein
VKRRVSGRNEEKPPEKVFREPPRPVLSLFFAAQVPSLARQKIEYYRRTTDSKYRPLSFAASSIKS